MREAILMIRVPAGIPAGTAAANTSHEGWPRINGMLLMNKTDAPRPLDARPGHDPFAGTDPSYSCDAVHKRGSCHRRMVRTAAGVCRDLEVEPQRAAGGHGNDWINAHFGRGSIDCGGGRDILFISRKAQRHYKIHGCERVSHKTLGR